MSNTIQNIQVDSAVAINLINNILPILEAYVPAVGANAGTINLGISAAAALLPLLSQIPTSSSVSAAEQAAQYARVYAVLSGKPLGPEWIKQI